MKVPAYFPGFSGLTNQNEMLISNLETQPRGADEIHCFPLSD
jgi:hypothetical protein